MSQKVWLGGIYLKEEGGYEIVLRSLLHYKKRLRAIDKSPELQGAPMFVQIVQQEAMKSHSAVTKTIEKIKSGLHDGTSLLEVESDIPILEKALGCYSSDIQKAGDDAFYSDLLAGNDHAQSDLANITQAILKIKEYS
ncbi:hypothetical protein [Candidatus Nitrosotenuis cloacae]|uniref:hypothetical protein n=1 Tax=Candidatus Nitrosotenuis cloacae TaxID=1603555 RepID=UPI00227FF33E|nr:hypothetical protein [Candidatus Nitrosotenuis cloacae]